MPFGPNAITLGYGQNTNTPTGLSAQVLQVNPAQAPANTVITGGSIDNTPIGQTTPAAGAFTTLSATTPLGVLSGGTGVGSAPANGKVLIGNGTDFTLANLTAGSGISVTNGSGIITIANTGGSGTVTSVAVSGGTTGLTISGSPVTTTGTMTIGGTLALANGGTGATTDTGARSNLGLGSIATQSAASVAITGGTVTGTTVSKVTITEPATAATLTIANGKTFTANDTVTVDTGGLVLGNSGGLTAAASKVLTVSNSLTLAGTDSTTMTFPTTSATIARTDAANTFTGHQTIEGVTSTGATGTGKFVFDGTPTLVTPVLGVATATSINKLTLTAPATAATLTIADGKTLTANNSLTLSGTDASTLNIGTGGTLGTAAYTAATAYSPVAGSASIVTTGALDSGSITSGFGSIDVGADAISGGAISGTTLAATGNTTIGSGGTAFLTVTNTTGTGGTTINAMGGPSTGNFKSADSLDTAATRWTFGRDNQTTGDFVFKNNGTQYMALNTTGLAVTGTLSATATITSTGVTSGIGYATGAGLAVTQVTNRTTGVTINAVCGAITLVSAAGSATYRSFTVTNSAVAATNTIILNQKSGTDLYEIHVTAIAAGSFRITSATTGGTTTEQPVINFAVIKAVAA